MGPGSGLWTGREEEGAFLSVPSNESSNSQLQAAHTDDAEVSSHL